MKEAVRVHFFTLQYDKGDLLRVCTVCVSRYAYIYIVLYVRVRDEKNEAREREMQSCNNLLRVPM